MAGYIGSKAVNLSTTGADINGDANIDGDLSFRDNDKIKLGAGSDLEIYHDGANSHIKDAGTGGLIIKGESSVQIRTSTANEAMLYLNQDGAVQVYYDGGVKLATTSTGIDVTGTVTSDGLTVNSGAVDNTALFVSSDASAFITFSDVNTTTVPQVGGQGDNLLFRTNNKKSVLIESNNDISFYEDTGTTPKFFWDASAERLGIGTTGPSTDVHIKGAGGTVLRLEAGNGVSFTDITQNQTNTRLDIKPDGTTYLSVDNSGDISFYEDTGTTAKFFWDASAESLGIGTSGNSPWGTTLSSLRLGSSGSVAAHASSDATYLSSNAYYTDGWRYVTNDAASNIELNGNNGDIRFNVAPTGTAGASFSWSEAARIDASGNVGIGESSPQELLHISGGGAPAIRLQDTTNAGTYALIDTGNNGQLRLKADVGQGIANSFISFEVDASEAARFDDSGNLLVGKTSASKDTVGSELKSDGRINATMTSGSPILANRQTTDGDIAVFQKDNTTVGSIGTQNGSDFYIGSSPATIGLRFQTNEIVPVSAAGANKDAAIDVGKSNIRFKDLYLSGGVVFGSTGGSVTSKTLDDYEGGTFTPAYASTGGTTTVSYTQQSGNYVKIGKMVFVRIKIIVNTVSATGSGILYVNLPFTAANQVGNGWTGEVGWNGGGVGWSTQPFNLAVVANSNLAYFHSLNMTNGIIVDLAPSALGNSCVVEASIKYEAA
jgi:hypothetical protein